MKPHAAQPRTGDVERGFSLVELMVGLSLGLVILTALVTLFVDISRSNQEMTKTNSQIENARFAMQLLQDDLVHAGYWGGFVPQFDDLTFKDVPDATLVPAGTAPDPCQATPWSAAYVAEILGVAVQVQDEAPAGCGSLISDLQPDTDVVIVRHAETCLPGTANCEADITGNLYFQPSFCELEIPTLPYVLGTSGLTLHKRDCVGTGTPPALPVASGTVAEKRKFISSIYYIRDYAVTAGDGIPTLMRSQLEVVGGTPAHQPAVPLIEGIEGFRVEVGLDSLSETGAAADYTAAIHWVDDENLETPTNRGDGSPDGDFVHCGAGCTSEQLINVVAVKLYLLARADRPTPGYTDTKTHNLGGLEMGPFNDGYKRHVFSTSVRLVNVSGRRETP